jgi:hypothetical protein
MDYQPAIDAIRRAYHPRPRSHRRPSRIGRFLTGAWILWRMRSYR